VGDGAPVGRRINGEKFGCRIGGPLAQLDWGFKPPKESVRLL